MEPWTITLSLLESGSGLVTGSQLRAAGVSPRWVSRQILAGRLHRVLPGVLSVTPDLEVAGWLRAVLAQAGPDAALTHVTALWNWGLVDDLDFPYHVGGAAHGLPAWRASDDAPPGFSRIGAA